LSWRVKFPTLYPLLELELINKEQFVNIILKKVLCKNNIFLSPYVVGVDLCCIFVDLKTTHTMKNLKNYDQKLTEAIGSALMNKSVTPDWILGHLSAYFLITDDIRDEVGIICENLKPYLVESN
jgi:hypothetical protein